MYLFLSIDILWLKSSKEEIAVEDVQGSCLLSPYWLSAEIGYWAHFSQYQCTENCSQKHQHLHPLNMLRKVLIEINDKTLFTHFPLEYRGDARKQQFPWVKNWISAQFVPKLKQWLIFLSSISQHAGPYISYKALALISSIFSPFFIFFSFFSPLNMSQIKTLHYIAIIMFLLE